MEKTPLSAPSVHAFFLLRLSDQIVGLGVGLFLLRQVHTMSLVDRDIFMLIAAGMLALTALFVVKGFRLWRTLKRVAVDSEYLYVCDYHRSPESKVPLDDVESISQLRSKGIRPVTIHLRAGSAFGRSIRFQPRVNPAESGLALQENQVVHDLRELVAKRSAG